MSAKRSFLIALVVAVSHLSLREQAAVEMEGSCSKEWWLVQHFQQELPNETFTTASETSVNG